MLLVLLSVYAYYLALGGVCACVFVSGSAFAFVFDCCCFALLFPLVVLYVAVVRWCWFCTLLLYVGFWCCTLVLYVGVGVVC